MATTNLTDLDEKSMGSLLLRPLNEIQQLSQTLFLSLSGNQSSRRPVAPQVSAFLDCDLELANALHMARKHQIKQQKIDSLKNEILELDSSWRQICADLETGKRELQTMINEGDERIKAIEKAQEASIPYPQLLAYAQSLSAFTSAPPNMPDMTLPGQPPPPLFFPPFPNEEKMRKGRLNAEAPLGLLGETHSVGRPPTVSPNPVEASHMGPTANPYRQDHRPPQQFFDLDLDLNPDL